VEHPPESPDAVTHLNYGYGRAKKLIARSPSLPRDEPLRATFAVDCCDREATSWVATTGGYRGDVVRDVMLAAVERRFGNVPKAPSEIEWMTDSGSGYIVGNPPKMSPLEIWTTTTISGLSNCAQCSSHVRRTGFYAHL
jgi:hypothetical protein